MAIYSVLLGLFCAQYFQAAYASSVVLVYIAVVFLFFLRTRLIDEIKDVTHDDKHYPDRPVQRGLVSIRELKVTALILVGIEIALQITASVSVPAFIVYGAFLAFTFLMSQDFFIPEILEKRFWLLVSVHHFVFLLLALYAGTLFTDTFFLPKNPTDWWFIIAVLIPPLLFELSRKLTPRDSAADTKHANDTYAKRWGVQNTLAVIAISITLFGFALTALIESLLVLLSCAIISGVLIVANRFESTRLYVRTYTPYISVFIGLGGKLLYIL
jgi:4-hydroxybenzoate polyprenyltransferase